MRILMYGDLQVNRKHQDYMKFLEGSMQNLFTLVKEQRPNLVANMGDLLDTHHEVDVEDLVWAWEWTRKIEAQCPPPGLADSIPRHLIVKGNHDIADRNASISSIQVMEGLNTLPILDVSVYRIAGVKILVLPYTRDYVRLREQLTKVDSPEDVQVILGHIEWVGARYTPTCVSDKGLELEEVTSIFPNAEIFNGHYHQPSSTGKLHMVGSPLHKDFNDIVSGVERGFLLYDTDSREVTRLTNHSTYYSLQLEFGDIEGARTAAEELSGVSSKVRVKVSVPTAVIEEVEELFRGFLWSSVIASDSFATSVFKDSSIQVFSTPSEIVTEAVDSSGDEYDKKLLRDYGMEAFS